MIAIISNKHDAHADFLQKEICNRNLEVFRINTEDLLAAPITIDYTNYAETDPNVFGEVYSKLRFVDAFWYRRPFPVSTSISDEVAKTFLESETRAVLAGLWYLFNSAYWISFPDAMNRAANKLLQLSVARSLNFNVPRTIITTDPNEAFAFHAKCKGDIIVKALHNSWFEKDGKISVIRTHAISEKDLDRIDSIRTCPTLFQERISTNYEIRVTVVGNKVFGCKLVTPDDNAGLVDYKSDISSLKISPIDLPTDLRETCRKLIRTLDLQFGAIDLIVQPDGDVVFLELNPNGQWLWLEEATGLPIADALINLLANGGARRP